MIIMRRKKRARSNLSSTAVTSVAGTGQRGAGPKAGARI
jgi:hypothetical protein